jgi:hypothetical protein
MYAKLGVLVAALTLIGAVAASAGTVHHRHQAAWHGYGSYARAYADTHTSIPVQPGYWRQGNFRSNTYPTYAPGVGGCVDDLGYGRVGGGLCQ